MVGRSAKEMRCEAGIWTSKEVNNRKSAWSHFCTFWFSAQVHIFVSLCLLQELVSRQIKTPEQRCEVRVTGTEVDNPEETELQTMPLPATSSFNRTSHFLHYQKEHSEKKQRTTDCKPSTSEWCGTKNSDLLDARDVIADEEE